LDVGVVSGGTKHEATDATESVDTDLDSGPDEDGDVKK